MPVHIATDVGDLFFVDLGRLTGDRRLPLGPEIVPLSGALWPPFSRRVAASSYSWEVDGGCSFSRVSARGPSSRAQSGRSGRIAEADAARRFVDQVDRLVGQVPVVM